MAKKQVGTSYSYPSRFGSHKTMVVFDPLTSEGVLTEEDVEKFGVITGERVLCEDENGRYLTSRNRLDNGLADPNRYLSSRLVKLYEKATDKKKK